MRRLHIPPVILTVAAVATVYGWAVVALTPAHPGAIGLNLNALGTDWMVFYGAVQRVFTGNLAGMFDGEQFTAYLNATFADRLSEPMPFRAWLYPPTFLLVVLPFGTLPFAASYAVFQLASGALLAAALWFRPDTANARPVVVAAALLGPAAAMNAGVGQNALLTAALMVGGFRLLPVRPALGGAVLGLLTVKPQLWLLVPVALIATRQWRPLFWAIVVAVALMLGSAAMFGLGFWRDWLAMTAGGLANPQLTWVRFNRDWGISIYACVHATGAGSALANAAQIGGTLLGVMLVFGAFRRALPSGRKIAILLAGTILTGPHSSLYETVLLATAAALWAGEAALGEAPLMAWTLALALWLAPLFNPPLVSPIGRLTPLLIAGFIAMAMRGAGSVPETGRSVTVASGARDPGMSLP